VSELEAKIPSVLLLAMYSFVASAFVALVVSVERLLVKVLSASVALVVSLFRLVVIVASPLVRSVTSY
jgi:hypothetical protein